MAVSQKRFGTSGVVLNRSNDRCARLTATIVANSATQSFPFVIQ
jgi:hypothetical protein